MTEAKHTPGKLAADHDMIHMAEAPHLLIANARTDRVNYKENAARMALCWNYHDELLAFVQEITSAEGKYGSLNGTPIVADAYRLLAKATGSEAA
jgi:hypothetical protein